MLRKKQVQLTFGPRRVLRRSSEFLEDSCYSTSQTMDNTSVLANNTKTIGKKIKITKSASVIKRRLSEELLARKARCRTKSYQLDAAALLDSRVKQFLSKHFRIWNHYQPPVRKVRIRRQRRLRINKATGILAELYLRKLDNTFESLYKARRSHKLRFPVVPKSEPQTLKVLTLSQSLQLLINSKTRTLFTRCKSCLLVNYSKLT